MKDYRNYPTKVRPLNSIVPQFFAIVVLSLLLTIQPSSSHSDIKSDMSNFKNIETIKEKHQATKKHHKSRKRRNRYRRFPANQKLLKHSCHQSRKCQRSRQQLGNITESLSKE